MQAPTGATPTPESAKQPYFTLTDFIFVVIAIVVGILVVRLGATTWTEGMHTEATKANGEKFAAWIEEAGAKRAAGEKTGVAACDADGASWADCRDALVAEGGPLAGLKNVAEPDGEIFAAACDRSQLATLGTIIVEKGLPKPPDGASLIYSAMPDAEPMKDALSMRVAICGRGYSQINVREVKF